jgi:hypothetical protein
MSNVVQLFPQPQAPRGFITFLRLGVWRREDGKVVVENSYIARLHTRWKKRFAYLPVKLDTGEKVWWRTYMTFQVWDWTGGIMGGYVWYHKATARKRHQVTFVERIDL